MFFNSWFRPSGRDLSGEAAVAPLPRAARVFQVLLKARVALLVAAFIGVGAAASQLPSLTADTRADAFVSPDHPALLLRERTRAAFGLKDSMAVAVINRSENGIFNAQSLKLVDWLTDEINRLPNIDADSTISLATENNIVGTYDGMIVESFFEEDSAIYSSPAGTQAHADELRDAIANLPLYQGNLVARDNSATMIVAEVLDVHKSPETYEALIELVAKAPAGPNDEIHIAGEAAVSGYLATYISNDAQRLVPLTGVVIAIILALCFMRLLLTPLVVIIGSTVIAFGAMAAFGVPFYVITNGLIANLLGIAVADSIHILSQHQEEIRARPQASPSELAARALGNMWRPVTLTTLSTMAGFLALYFASEMPPLRAYGLFGAFGVGVAWLLSVTALPAAMASTRPKLGRPFKKADAQGQNDDLASKFMRLVGRIVLSAPRTVALSFIGLAAIGVWGASQVIVNERAIENFSESEPIVTADREINRTMDGTYFIDIVIETPNFEDLHRPENLKRIEDLQVFLEGLPNINGSFSIAESVRLMHRAVNEDRSEAYIIPDDNFLISQLYLLYSASASPTDFEDQIDPDYQKALVRASFNKGEYRINGQTFPLIEDYLANTFNTDDIKGQVTGRLHVDYNLIGLIAENHARSVVLALLAVLLMSVLVFRSFAGGLLAIVPVVVGVLSVYAIMGFGGIWLGLGTSMFAAIAIGLGVDFAIHTLDRLRDLVRDGGFSPDNLMRLYPSTGRALFFNFFGVSAGFGILFLSDVPPLLRFGGLVAVAVSAAFIASMTLLPALITLLRPRFLTRGRDTTS